MYSRYMNKILRVENWLNCIRVEVCELGRWFLGKKKKRRGAFCQFLKVCFKTCILPPFCMEFHTIWHDLLLYEMWYISYD